MPKKLQTLIMVLGEMGMGKTHTAKFISDKTGMHFFEGDEALPPGMKLDTKEAVTGFVVDHLIPAIKLEMATHDDVVVAQALYFQEHREKILEEFKDIAHIKFINVASTEEWQIKNLANRSEPEKWVSYAKFSKPYFEKPPETSLYSTIENSHDEREVKRQINNIFSSFVKDRLVPLQMLMFFAPPVSETKMTVAPSLKLNFH